MLTKAGYRTTMGAKGKLVNSYSAAPDLFI